MERNSITHEDSDILIRVGLRMAARTRFGKLNLTSHEVNSLAGAAIEYEKRVHRSIQDDFTVASFLLATPVTPRNPEHGRNARAFGGMTCQEIVDVAYGPFMGPERPRIELFRGRDVWMARFVNEPDVISAFGTDTLPTPYTRAMEPNAVLAAVQKANARTACEVVLL